MSLVQKPIIGGYNPATEEVWCEWQIQLQGVGNRSTTPPVNWGVCTS